MSADVLATAAHPAQDVAPSADAAAGAGASIRDSSPIDSAATAKASPARGRPSTVNSSTPVASTSRSISKSAIPSKAKQDKKRSREGSLSNDTEKAKDREREARLPACEACRSRKVKCDALLPACTPCRKSGRECFGRDKVPNVSRGLVYDLQQKVKDLESRLALASSVSARNGHSASTEDEDSDGSRPSSHRRGRPPAKRTRSSLDGPSNFDNGAQSADSDSEASSSDSASTSPQLVGPSPNAFIQQTSTILESLSSDLTGSAHRQYQRSPNRPTTQSLDNDEASALAALSRRHSDRAKSPHRLKRRSSSNASRYREEASSHLAGPSRFKDATPAYTFKSRPRHGRIGTISAYERTFFDRLIARYLTYMNTALPVINEVRMRELAASVYQDDERSRLSALSESSYDSMPPPPLPPSPVTDRVTLSKHRYVVLMCLAIALASLGRSHNFSPELRRLGTQYWAEAQALFPMLFRFGDLDKLRATILQLQYALLVPSAGSVWELSGAAIRLVTELNLHVDREYDSAANAPFTCENIDLRRRLFWTTYCLDRSLSVALARPPGLSDAWIHVQLPSLLSDAELLRLDREGSAPVDDSTEVDPHKQIFRAHVNLRRVQSEILCRLHSVNPRDYALDNDGVGLSDARPSLALVMEVGPPTPNLEWQSRMMDKLVDWRSEYEQIQLGHASADRRATNEGVSSTATPFITREWIDLNHHLTISLLFRPSPNNPRPDSHGLQQAFTASGRAMKIYKSMHRSSTINFPWLATHHLFISGLTHLNALEKLTRTGVSCPSPVVEVVFNVQSCASTLEALTTRDDGYGTKIRDTFDAAASAVLRSVLEPGSARQTSSLDMSVEDLVRGSPAYSLNAQHPTIAETNGSLRRASQQHEALLHAAQHPTWLSDSTWNSLNGINAAPPPGSTIFVAAPPRVGGGRFGAPGRSLTPTLSERTTQNAGAVNAPAGTTFNGAAFSPRSLAMQSSYAVSLSSAPAMTFANLANSGNPFAASGTTSGGADVGGNAKSQAGSDSTDPTADRNTSTFGFHNWLLQPYEGGADSLGFGVSSAINTFANGTSASPSSYAGVDPFQGVYPAEQRIGGAADRQGAAETDASTLLDFLSMLPAAGGAGRS